VNLRKDHYRIDETRKRKFESLPLSKESKRVKKETRRRVVVGEKVGPVRGGYWVESISAPRAARLSWIEDEVEEEGGSLYSPRFGSLGDTRASEQWSRGISLPF